MRRILLPEEWGMVEPVVTGEFGNAMPATPAQGSFLAEVDGGRVLGFVHVETVFHFAAVHVAPEARARGLGLDLARDAASRIPAGFSALWLTDRYRGRLARRLKGREVGTYTVFRRDA